MTIPDKDKIVEKLKSDGLSEVKKKLAVGAYAQNKQKIVESESVRIWDTHKTRSAVVADS